MEYTGKEIRRRMEAWRMSLRDLQKRLGLEYLGEAADLLHDMLPRTKELQKKVNQFMYSRV